MGEKKEEEKVGLGNSNFSSDHTIFGKFPFNVNFHMSNAEKISREKSSVKLKKFRMKYN